MIPKMPDSIAVYVQTMRVPKETREAAKRGEIPREWRSAWVVRFYHEKTAEAVLGSGSSRRVAAMRAAEAACAEGWF